MSSEDDSGLDLVPYNSAVLEVLHQRIGKDEQGIRGFEELASILELAAATSAGSRIKVEPV